MPSEKFVLVIETDKAKKKYREAGLEIDDVNEGLENLDELRLFYYETEGDRKKSENGKIAIPYDNGDYVLLVKQGRENENNFIAVNFLDKRKKRIFLDGHKCRTLDNTRCKLIDQDHKITITRYSSNAVDHQKLEHDVQSLEPWDLSLDLEDVESKKWMAYFRLYKGILESQKASFVIHNIKIRGKHLFADIEGRNKEGNNRINGKNLIFSLGLNCKIDHNNKVGEIKQTEPQKMKIMKDQDFLKKYCSLMKDNEDRLSLKDGKTLTIKILSQDDFNVQKLSGNYVEKGKIEFTIHGEEQSSFVANTLISAPNQHEEYIDEQYQDHATTAYFVNEGTIQPLNLACAVDYFSDEFQLKIMKDCFYEVQQMPIWKVLSGKRVSKLPQKVDIPISNPKLNKEQKEAVRGALNAKELFLIWGPPGTGKTEVIKEIAKHESERGNKTLIVSQSNSAVDNALSRLFDSDSTYPLRIAKDDYKLEGEDSLKVPFLNSVPRFYLEFLKKHVEENPCDEGQDIQKQFLKEIDKKITDEGKEESPDKEHREIKQFTKMYKRKINVVGATLMESGKAPRIDKGKGKEPVRKLLHETGINEFDTVIIDEVSKATPPEMFIPIPLGKKLILVGDYKQLPPMFNIPSEEHETLEKWAKEVGVAPEELDFENTIFERLWDRHTGDASPVRARLTRQYRMHPDIQNLIEQFYKENGESLTCGLDKEEIQALDIDHDFFKDHPAIWINTTDGSQEKKLGTSFYNEYEIKKVGVILNKLLELGDKDMSVGVITFYNAQLQKLKREYDSSSSPYKKKFGEGKLVFGTVDRFQGRECDVIICSLVRNNKYDNIGFAKKPNRINVAFSRARKALIILGSDTFPYNRNGGGAKEIYEGVYEKCWKPSPKEYSS